MTCIVGIQHDGRVYIGGDSAGVAGYAITTRADTKVFTTGPYVMGFTTSFRMGQLLHYSLDAPAPRGKSLDKFMATTFIDAVRDCLDKGGWLSKDNDREEGGTFLVGVAGNLYAIDSDHQIGRTVDGYAAVGCGSDLALGSLFTTQKVDKPKARIKAALEAAAYHSAGVTPPFIIKAR